MANSSIDLIPLDFDTLKSSFITYLRSQDQFKDYNFEASNMNVLLDLLSYNTYKNSFYTNMAFAESFIDSAQLRESMFSHAKELNYVPRSARSSVANVTLTFSASGESQPYTLRKGESFTTLIKQGSYTFTTGEDIILTSSNTIYSANFNIYEGFYVTESYVMDYNQNSQKFKINNTDVDLTSLVVLVYEDNSVNPKKYTRATTLLDLNENSEVYFVQGSIDAQYEIIFGDGVLGRRPKNGGTVVLDYRVTAGSIANGARVFSANFDPTAAGELLTSVNVSINKFSEATGGAYSVNGDEPESTESIRYYAPRHFQTQERAVTVSDYVTVLKTQYPEISALTVYGGEEVSPPRYGKVFVAVDIANVEGLPEAKKTEYYSFLKSRSPLSIDPIFVEPVFTYLEVESLVKYNINVTTRTPQNIEAACTLAISEFAETNLNDFNSILRYSKLIRAIDDVDTSIVSNETEIHVYKKLTPLLTTPQNININFNLPIKETDYVSDQSSFVSSARHEIKLNRSVHSSFFTYNGEKCIIEDDGAGIIRVVREQDNFHYVVKDVGTVNYKTGELQLVNFAIDSYDGNFFKIYVSPASLDIVGSKNEILAIEPDEILIIVETVRE